MGDVIRHSSLRFGRAPQPPSDDLGPAPASPPGRAGTLTFIGSAAALLLHDPLQPWLGAQAALAISLLAVAGAALAGGLWSGLGTTLLLALLMPWGSGARPALLLFVPLGLALAWLGQARHDQHARRPRPGRLR